MHYAGKLQGNNKISPGIKGKARYVEATHGIT